MKSLKESILGNMEDTIGRIESDCDMINTFGGTFKFYDYKYYSKASKLLNAASLKKLTKNMRFYNKDVETGVFDSAKTKMFINWLDHIRFSDLKMNERNAKSMEFKIELCEKLTDLCINESIGNEDRGFHLWVNTSRNCPPNEFWLMINNTRNAISETMMFKYKITI